MLLESIPYDDSSIPFYTTFSNIAEEDYHKHRELEIILVLQGETNCTIHHLEYNIKKGDILIIDTEDMHRIHGSSEDLIILSLYIDLERFTYKYPNLDYIIFVCEDVTKGSWEKYDALQNKTSLLKSYMARIMFEFKNDTRNNKRLMELIDKFIDILVEQFQGFYIEDKKFKSRPGKGSELSLERLYRIIKYIYINYDKNIMLKDLAKLEHLNHYYVSHLIKDSTGLSFKNFLNYIRVEHAEAYLVEGNLTLTQICQQCGFSSSEYFNKCFQKWHGISPAKYRKKLKRYRRGYCKPFLESDALELLSYYSNDYARLKDTSQKGLESTARVIKEIELELKKLENEELENILSYTKFLTANSK